jgi:ABC-type multidrug transport system ATPase subunit
MTIKLENAGKRFEGQWIFKGITYEFSIGKTYAITGHNGSGKSTLLKVIAGMLTPNEGSVSYYLNGINQSPEEALLHTTFCAPYLELPEELTVGELLRFHSAQRELEVSFDNILSEIQIGEAKQIRTLSSGMKQRLKLALAIFTKADAVFLDEPTSNFDTNWEAWYKQVLQHIYGKRLLIISSNHSFEYKDFAAEEISMNTYSVR